MQLIAITYKIQALINAPKIHTDLLWDLTFLFVGLTIVYFIGVFFFRNSISSKFNKVKLHKKELSPMISEFLFYEDDAPKDEKTRYVNLKLEIRQLLKDDFNRKVLSEILIDLRKDVAGDTQKRLFKLYKDLELHKDAYKKLNSWRWETISKGIFELTQMQVEESYDFITKYVNDKRGTIRKQAEIAAVTLKREGINYFLDTTRYKISEWQQLKLLDVIRNFDDFQPPRFKAWLTSSNRYVVLFALRLIKYYNQNDVNASLIELVKHKNNHIKDEALKCIKEFNIVEAIETLKAVFWKCTVHIKISILDVIATIGSTNDIDFLQLIEKKERNFSVKSKALSAINAISPESILPTEGIQDISGYQIPQDIVADIPEDKEVSTSEVAIEILKEEVSTKDAIVEVGTPQHNTMEVVYEEVGPVLESELQNEKEIEFLERDLNDKDLIKSLRIDFIPIVTDIEEITKKAELQTDSLISKSSGETPVDEFEVKYEVVEVIPTSSKNTSKLKKPRQYIEFEMASLHFLPIVVDDEKELEKESRDCKYRFNTNAKLKLEHALILKTNAVFEEVKFIPNTADIHVVFELLSTNELKNQKSNNAPLSTADIDNNSIRGLEICFEVVDNSADKPSIEPTYLHDIDWQLDKIHDSDLTMKIENSPQNKPSLNDLALTNDDDIDNFINNFPNSLIYDEPTRVKMLLLDDIEELGDKREIPLLLEYLHEEDSDEVKLRIREIVHKFSYSEIEQMQLMESRYEKREPRTSIAELFFKECDLEAQVILLESIGDLMGKEEFGFLQGLMNDERPTIRETAKNILIALRLKISQEKDSIAQVGEELFEKNCATTNTKQVINNQCRIGLESIENSKCNDAIFDIGFQIISEEQFLELPLEKRADEHAAMNVPESLDQGFIGRLLKIPIKIFEKFNG